jgi:hypothetical protein
MTTHQALALGIRLFAIWCALVIVREIVAFLVAYRPHDDTSSIVLVMGGVVVSLVVLLCLWQFPKSIARGLLPDSTEVPTQSSSYQMWFTVGTALIGLWFIASAIAPILRNLALMYIFRSELKNAENLRSLRAGVLYYTVELVLGLCLLFGATVIRKLIWRVRDIGHH